MSDIVIKAENLGKSYIIGHEKRERYTALRDVLANKARQIAGKTRQIFKGGQLISGSEMEEFWALKDLNFEIKQGDRVGIIGRNGAGKSTLLKVLSRITEPTTGKVSIKGRVASLLEVGTGFHPELTGRENIYLNGAILGMSRVEIRKKYDEIVNFSGVEKFLDTPVKRYSSGMYVRLAFAVAAHLEPEILVVDEVLAVGDAEFQKKALGKMQDVSQGEGRTVLFVSHNMTAVKSLCTKGICLRNGSLHKIGDIENVVNDYLSNTIKLSKVILEKDNENEFVVIKEIELMNNLNGFFNIDEVLDIQIKLKNKTIQEKINVNLFFNTVEGGVIFATVSNQENIPIGDFIATCHIPANFLNDNNYFLNIMVVKNGETPVMYLQNIMLIEGVEPARETSWLGKFPGLLRPKLNWEIKFE